jgi:MFS family permease
MAFSTGMFLGPVAAGFLMDIGGFTAVMVTFAVSLLVCTPIIVDWVDVWHRIKNRND